MNYVNHIEKHDRKIKRLEPNTKASNTKAPNTKPPDTKPPDTKSITGASSQTNTKSLFEATISYDVLSHIQRFWTLSDILSVVNVNHFFNNFFKLPMYLRSFDQFQQLTITSTNAKKASKNGDWSRYHYLSKLDCLLHYDECRLGYVFSQQLPTQNLWLYRGYYFILQRFNALRVVIFEYDPVQSQFQLFYDIRNGWLNLEKSEKRLQLLVINKNPQRVYPSCVKCEIIMFNESYCHMSSMETAVKHGGSDIIIYQNCQIETTYSNPLWIKDYHIRPRAVIFIDMYAWYSMWAICHKGYVLYKAGFEKLMYKGQWEKVVEKPNPFWEMIISYADEYGIAPKSISGTVLFTIDGVAEKDTLKLQKQMANEMFADISVSLNVMYDELQLWKSFIIGIGSIEDAKSAFVFDLVKVFSAAQIKEQKKKWLDVLDGKSQVNSDLFWQEWCKIKQTAKM